MADAPWYGSDVPYYAENDPGNIALGENEETMYYRDITGKNKLNEGYYSGPPRRHIPRQDKVYVERTYNELADVIPPQGKKYQLAKRQREVNTTEAFMVLKPKGAHKLEYIDNQAVMRMLRDARKERLTLLNPAAHSAKFERMKCDIGGQESWCDVANFKRLANLVDSYDLRHGITYTQGDDYDPFNYVEMDSYGDMEHLTLLNPAAHMSKFEYMKKMDKKMNKNMSEKKNKKIPLIITKDREFLAPNSKLSMDHIHKLFKPRDERMAAVAVARGVPATMDNIKKLYVPREGMENPGISSDSNIPIAMQLFKPNPAYVENFVTGRDMPALYSVFEPGSGRQNLDTWGLEKMLSVYTPTRLVPQERLAVNAPGVVYNLLRAGEAAQKKKN